MLQTAISDAHDFLRKTQNYPIIGTVPAVLNLGLSVVQVVVSLAEVALFSAGFLVAMLTFRSYATIRWCGNRAFKSLAFMFEGTHWVFTSAVHTLSLCLFASYFATLR